MLSAVPQRSPWQLLGAAIEDPATEFKFELYDVRNDWTQYIDVAAIQSRKVQEMRDRPRPPSAVQVRRQNCETGDQGRAAGVDGGGQAEVGGSAARAQDGK
jgi:hypothetical protein